MWHVLLAQVVGEDVHDRLVHVLDEAVVEGVHVEVVSARAPLRPPEKPVRAMTARPCSLAQAAARTTFSESPEALTVTSTSPVRARVRSG